MKLIVTVVVAIVYNFRLVFPNVPQTIVKKLSCSLVFSNIATEVLQCLSLRRFSYYHNIMFVSFMISDKVFVKRVSNFLETLKSKNAL